MAKLTEGKMKVIQGLLEEYDIETAEDIQNALKDLLGGTIQSMMETEMDHHLGYEKFERSTNANARNGKKTKKVRSNYGDGSTYFASQNSYAAAVFFGGKGEIEVPQDRNSDFQPEIVKKRQKDISEIDQKIISMYAKGIETRHAKSPKPSKISMVLK